MKFRRPRETNKKGMEMEKMLGHMSMSKEELQDWLRTRPIPFDETYPINTLRKTVANFVRDDVMRRKASLRLINIH